MSRAELGQERIIADNTDNKRYWWRKTGSDSHQEECTWGAMRQGEGAEAMEQVPAMDVGDWNC